MVSGPTNIANTPVMHYRPDPGEPAVRLSAKEPETAGLVTLQEQRNETRLLQRAMAKGEDVLFSHRTFTLGVGQTSPTYNAGLTTVVTRPDQNGFVPDSTVLAKPAENQLNPNDESQQQQSEKSDNENTASDLQSATQPTEEELDQKKQDLDTEDQRLERNLIRATMEQNQAYQTNDTVQYEQARREESNLQRQQQENDQEQRKIEVEQLQQKLQGSQNSSNQTFHDNEAAAEEIPGDTGGQSSNQDQSSHGNASSLIPDFSFAQS